MLYLQVINISVFTEIQSPNDYRRGFVLKYIVLINYTISL